MKKSARKIAGIFLCLILIFVVSSCHFPFVEETDSGTTSTTDGGNENYKLEFNKQRYSYIGIAEAISADKGAITIREGGTYELSGVMNDGSLIIDVGKEKTVRLIFKNLTMISTSTAPVFVRSADKVIIELETGSVNYFADGNDYIYANPADTLPNACIFSMSDLEITGKGTLNISGNYSGGIGCRKKLTVTDGTLNITAAENAISGVEGVFAKNSTIAITKAADGIKSAGTDDGAGVISLISCNVSIVCKYDAIQSSRSIYISGGTGNLFGEKNNYVSGFINDNGNEVPGILIIPGSNWTKN